MERMFGTMMKGFMSGMSEEDKLKMSACFEKMSSVCPCCGGKDVPVDEKKAMPGKMMSFCGGKTE